MSALIALDREQVKALSPEDQRQMVGQFIEQGRDMLARAIATSDLDGIVSAKGAAATVTEMTRQLGLSKEARIDAEELVRRSEYALGKAIRVGQEAGTVASGRGGDRRSAEARIKTDDISFDPPKPEDIEPSFYANGSQMASLSDGVEPEQFEDALAEAKAEGNVSRANVARKVDQRRPEPKAEPKPAQPKQRRRPLPEAFWHAAIKVHKAVESVDRLVKDDRFPQNAEKVAGANLSDLLRARDLLNQVIESMPNTH